MKWDWAMVQAWFASSEVKKRSKKVSSCNIVPPPLSFIMIHHVAYRVIINDALADEVVGRVLDPRLAVIIGCRVVEQCGPPTGRTRMGVCGRCGMRPQRVNFPGRWWCPPANISALRRHPQPMNKVFFGLWSSLSALNLLHPSPPPPPQEATADHCYIVEPG